MIPLSLRKGKHPAIVSQLQVKRLHQELANAHKKLEEYEDLIASLYDTLEAVQFLACHKCRVNFGKVLPANFAAASMTTQAAMPPPTGNPPELGEHYAGHMMRDHSHHHSRNPFATNLVDGSRSALPSRGVESTSYEYIPTSPYHGGQHLDASSISSRPSSSASNYDGQYLQAPTISSRPPSSASGRENQTQPLHKPVLCNSNEPDSWSISFDKRVKPSIEVKLVDVLEYKEMVSCLKFSHDGIYLAVGLDNGQTYVHDVKLGKKACILAELSTTHLPPKRDRIWVMNFSLDGKYLATGNQSTIIRVWDIKKRHVHNIFKHQSGVSGVDFTQNGRFLVSAAHDGTVRAWSLRDGSYRVYSDTDASYYSLRLTPDGRHITAADYDGQLHIWDIRTGQEVGWKGHDGPATISLMPNGKGLVTCGWDKTIKYWDLSFLGETQLTRLELKEILRFTGHTNVVRGVTILADGKWVISISEDLTVRMWDSRTASRQCTMNGHERDIWWVDASPAGNYFASGGNDGRVAIWRSDPIYPIIS